MLCRVCERVAILAVGRASGAATGAIGAAGSIRVDADRPLGRQLCIASNRIDGQHVVLFKKFNSNFGEDRIAAFKAKVSSRGVRSFEHRHVLRGRMAQQLSCLLTRCSRPSTSNGSMPIPESWTRRLRRFRSPTFGFEVATSPAGGCLTSI